MTPTLILWAYAPASILFVTLALNRWRRDGERALAVALGLTALWALAVAGIGSRDVAARVTEGARDLAWLFVTATLGGRLALRGVRRIAIGFAACLPIALIALSVMVGAQILDVGGEFEPVLNGIRLLVALAGLVLLRRSWDGTPSDRLAAAIAMLWGVDLLIFAAAYLVGPVSGLVWVRGISIIAAGAAFVLAIGPRDDRSFGVSRDLRLRLLAGAAFLIYTAIVVAATAVAAELGGTHARALQTAIVSGAAATLVALFSTPWLRAWTRVVVEKNLFGHRYDYRVAWRRFTDTLGRPGEDGPLPVRVVQAVADLLDAPAGLLLTAADVDLESSAAWRWHGETQDGGGPALGAYLARTGRIVELDQVRSGVVPADEVAAVPDWMRADRGAWAIVPLFHLGSLVGAILLARPPVARTLDWEDLDLLRLAGRQAASYLAEDRAHAALADAERFDEFSRRFAFILHDIKNLISQIALVARNAERHADNPAFRADMIATLQDSAERMTALIARLSHRPPVEVRRAEPVDVATLIGRVARARLAQHPVVASFSGNVFALVDPDGLIQALDHLVQNAIDASGPDIPVTIAASVTDDRAVIEVTDLGAGMSPAFVRAQLFRPVTSSKSDGFGLGAFESRQLVRAMGGTLAVESHEGEGTCFRITLPLAAVLEEAA
jgi:putative PEP-CTERM system histidine kinase